MHVAGHICVAGNLPGGCQEVWKAPLAGLSSFRIVASEEATRADNKVVNGCALVTGPPALEAELVKRSPR